MKKAAESPRIVIIAGPNGAGKTTFAQEYLSQEAGFPDFINVDLIAQGLSPFAPDKAALQAGKIMLAQIARMVSHRENFAFETTLSGLSYARHIPRWRQAGYHIKLIFLSLPSVDLAIARVKNRAAQGGHNVPADTVCRRFDTGLRNFWSIYSKIVDSWELYDNSGSSPRLMDKGSNA